MATRLLIAGMAALLLAGASYVWVDRPALLWVDTLSAAERRPFRAMTDLGKGEVSCLVAGSAAAFFAWRKRWRPMAQALLVPAAVAVAGLVVQILKHLVGRYRPGWFLEEQRWGFSPLVHPFHADAYDMTSLPSGHSATIAAAATVASLLWPRLAFLWVAIALFIGTTRIFTKSHYPSDVILGLYVGWAAAYILRQAWHRLGWWPRTPIAVPTP